MKHNWTYKKLGEVVKCYRGLTYSKADEVPVSSKMVLRSNNIDLDTHALNFDEIKCVREDLPIADDRKLKKDSIFICMSNGSMQHLGKVAYVDKDYDYAFGGFMGLIVPNPQEVFPKYVYYSLLAPNFLVTILREGRGANINNLRFTDLENYSLPMPAKDEQKSIVQELDGINRLIDLQEEQLREYDRLAQSLFYSTFGDPTTNPKGWEVKTIGDMATFINGKAHEQDIDEDGAYTLINSKYISSDGSIYKKTNAQIEPLYVNDIVMVMSDVPNGRAIAKCILIKENGKYTLNQRICAFRNYEFHPFYLLYSLNRNQYYLNFDNGNSQTNLRKDDVLGCPIMCPPLDLQQSFAAQIEAIEQQKALICKSLDDTRTLLAARMQYYFE